MRVLVAEDHKRLAEAVAAGLRDEGMAVDVVLDGQDALDRGADPLRRARAGSGLARAAWRRGVQDPGRGPVPDQGADAHGREHGRGPRRRPRPGRGGLPGEAVRLRRAGGPDPGAGPAGRRAAAPVLDHGDLSVDPARRVAFREGRRLALTPKEFAVLECLLAAQGALVSAEELLERVWDENADLFTTTVKTTIGRLRAKLGDPPLIQTVREAGYRIGEEQ